MYLANKCLIIRPKSKLLLKYFFKWKQGFHGDTHSEEVGAAFGLLPDGCWGVGGLRDVDAELLLAGAGRGRHRGRVVAQAPAAITRLEGQKCGLRLI